MNKRYTRAEVLEKFGNVDNDLVKIATKYNSTKITDPECIQYCEFYDRHFRHLRDKPMKILEIGVKEGDSLLMWKDYFHKGEIFGLEYNPEPLIDFSHEKIRVYIGDQTDLHLLSQITEEAGPFDIIIDDASHVVSHQQASFDFLFPKALKSGGLYVMEDLCTSYWEKWGGGLRRPESTIEFLKDMVDGLNYRFFKGGRKQYVGIPEPKKVQASYLDKNVVGLSFYKNCCVIEKGTNPLEA